MKKKASTQKKSTGRPSKKSVAKKKASKKTSPTKKKSKKKARKNVIPAKALTPTPHVQESDDFRSVEAEIVTDFTPKKPPAPSSESETSGAELVPTDPFGQYLSEIRKYPLLTPEEEKELAVRYYENKDPIAAEKLVTSNLRFVVKIALEYAKMGAKLMDVVQEGNVGLMHAVKEYNPYKGVKLITYAVWWIRGYIREYLMKQFSMVRIGTTQGQKKLYYNLEKEGRELELLGHDPNDVQLLSSRLGVREQDVELMQQRMSGRDVSLDAPLDDEGSSLFVDFQTDGTTPEEQLEVLELVDMLKEKVDELRPILNDKELDILENRILADEPQTLQEIGDRYGISRERTRQLEARVLKSIKQRFLEVAQDSIEDKIRDS